MRRRKRYAFYMLIHLWVRLERRIASEHYRNITELNSMIGSERSHWLKPYPAFILYRIKTCPLGVIQESPVACCSMKNFCAIRVENRCDVVKVCVRSDKVCVVFLRQETQIVMIYHVHFIVTLQKCARNLHTLPPVCMSVKYNRSLIKIGQGRVRNQHVSAWSAFRFQTHNSPAQTVDDTAKKIGNVHIDSPCSRIQSSSVKRTQSL